MIGPPSTPKEAALKVRLTPEFLATLREAVRVVGWAVDAVESIAFVRAVHDIAGVPCERADVEPHEVE